MCPLGHLITEQFKCGDIWIEIGDIGYFDSIQNAESQFKAPKSLDCSSKPKYPLSYLMISFQPKYGEIWMRDGDFDFFKLVTGDL